MARSWTRLHEFLGSPPGPVTYDMVAEAVRRDLGESDDLDWKQFLPSAKVKGQWNEFAKDVAAMANTRGGLLIYGVSDDINMAGLDLSTVDDKQLGQWLRVHLQPTVNGVSYLKLEATDGSAKDVLVVDVPASESAPHFLYGWEDKDKGKTTFNAPFRHRDDTAYMAEHQVAAAYRDRFRRQDAAEAALQRHVQHTTDLVLNESGDVQPTAWLIVAARLSRPIPRLVAQPTRPMAQLVIEQSSERARALLAGAVRMPRLLGPQLIPDLLNNDPRKGLRRWVDTNLLVPAWSTNRRGILLELHHDGTVVTAVDLSHNALPKTRPEVVLPVISWVLTSAIFETVALAHEHRQALHSEAPMDMQVVVQTRATTSRFTPVVLDFGRPDVAERARQPSVLQPAFGELAPFADDQALIATGRELTEGLLHQFGLDMPD